jgi:hypothetical protein
MPVINHFVMFLSQLWSIVAPALTNLANWFLNDAIPQIVAIIQNSILPIIGSLIEFLTNLWINTEPFLIQLYDWFYNTALPAIMNFISTVVLPGIQILIDALGRIWNDVAPFLLQLWDWFLYTGMPLIVSFIEDVVMPVIQWLIDLLIDIWELVSPFLFQLYDWFMTSAMPAIMDFITGPVTTVIQGFIDLLAGIWNLVSTGLNLLKDGIYNVFNWIQVNVIDPIIGRITDFINLFNEARNTASQGIQTAVDSYQWAGQAAGQIGQGLASGQIGWGELFSATGNAIAKEFGWRDNGGWGNAGGAYMIGTGAQPELFVPSTSGTFIPNADQLGGVNISGVTIYASGYNEGQAAARGFHDEFMRRYRERS